MTNPAPDAALLWAREQIAGLVERNNEAAAVMRGESREDEVDVLAEAFRAGQSHDAGLLAACEAAERAINEYYRYMTGGETRGSYDGKPERQGLWDAQRIVRAAIAAAKGA